MPSFRNFRLASDAAKKDAAELASQTGKTETVTVCCPNGDSYTVTATPSGKISQGNRQSGWPCHGVVWCSEQTAKKRG